MTNLFFTVMIHLSKQTIVHSVMKTVKTKHYVMYVSKSRVKLAKCRKTGRFVKLSVAQAMYDKQRVRSVGTVYDNFMLIAIAFTFCCLFYSFHTNIGYDHTLLAFTDNIVISVLLSSFISVTWAAVAIMIKQAFINNLTVSK